ncbi:MAG: sugar phosphate isomerase/epimerase [Clostridia bacterium]|nr:sugar phosphate isomerase/epimerase [Clostridia bacterium]
MKTSTEIASFGKYIGEEKAVELVGKCGFDAWDLSMFAMAPYDKTTRTMRITDHPLQGKDYLSFVRRLKRIGEDQGIHCNQSHAPFPVYIPEIHNYLKRAIECTAEAGGSICVIHPDNYSPAEKNAEMFLELLPFAKGCGVKIATENMWLRNKESGEIISAACSDPQSFLAHLEAVNDPFFVACLDVGHAEMRGVNTSAPEMIRALGHHLQALHLHDNDLKEDLHRLPFTMQIDFTALVKALKEIGYDGYFTLEADQHCKNAPIEQIPLKVKEMADATRRLADLFEEM